MRHQGLVPCKSVSFATEATDFPRPNVARRQRHESRNFLGRHSQRPINAISPCFCSKRLGGARKSRRWRDYLAG